MGDRLILPPCPGLENGSTSGWGRSLLSLIVPALIQIPYSYSRSPAGGLGRVDVQGVEPGGELGFQGLVDGPVFRQPGESGEGAGADMNSIVGLAARCCTSMTVVQMRLVHYIQHIRRKSSSKSAPNALRAGCQFLRH
jgi:hypothetical protein